jgi:hypothetical protein
LIADDKRFFKKIPELEINTNDFFGDSVNDNRYVVFHILKLKRTSHLFNSVFFVSVFD